MIITPMSENVFKLPFSLKKEQENQELLPDYNKSVAINNSQDSVHFSQSSLTKLQESSGENSEDQQNRSATFLYNKNGERVHTEAPVTEPDPSGEGIDADQQTIDSLRKQIREIEKKIVKTQTKLSEAMAEVQDKKSGVELEPTGTNQSTPPLSALQAIDANAKSSPEKGKEGLKGENQSPEATAAVPETGAQTNSAPEAAAPEAAPTGTSDMDAATKAMINAAIAQTEVEMISSELKSLNTQLLNLNNKLADAIKGKMGGSGGPPGAAGGTPAMGGV